MITKNEFIKFMTDIKELHDIEDNINKAMKPLSNDLCCFNMERPIVLAENILEKAMDDVGGWIMYYMYEIDWGKKDGGVTGANGKKIPLRTFSDLYNLLTTPEE